MNGKVVEFSARSQIEAEAAAWLIRLDGDPPVSREEFEALRDWLHRSSVHREELRSLAAHWEKLNVLTELAVPLGKLHREPRSGHFLASRDARVLAGRLTAFAALVLLGVLVVIELSGVDRFRDSNGLYATAVGQQQEKTLADGSIALLNTNSQIDVNYNENSRDIRLLQGEVHFTVAKDRSRPFRVFAGNELIQAVGTAFAVRLRDDIVSVAVTEGRVSLASQRVSAPAATDQKAPAASGALPSSAAILNAAYTRTLGALTAGQVGTIRIAPGTRISSLEQVQTIAAQEMARRLSWREGTLMFSGETLSEVVDEISRYTTVSIEIANPAVREIRIGGRFQVGEIEGLLAALETNFGLEVTRLDRNRVVLSARTE